MRRLAIVISSAAALCAAAALPSAASAQSGFKMFTSPSGNIACALARDFARCDIKKRDWPTPAKPKGCMLDWGQGLAIEMRGRGRVVCAGDTVWNRNRALAYGRTTTVGRFTCSSRRSGMACTNTKTAHGFEISRTSYRLF